MSYKSANNSYELYERTINNNLEFNSLDFLNNSNISGIFGVDKSFGILYCKQIAIDFPDYKELISKGYYKEELGKIIPIGNQEKFFSEELNTIITANVARYIYHALLINKYIIKKFNSSIIDIVEIGGGYGGLCYWLKKINKNILTYTIIDLPMACRLQSTYLNMLNTSCKSISDVNEYTKSDRPLFIISNYGYSEFNDYYQNLYKNTIIKLADSGFMVWNNWTGIYSFTDLPMIIEKERPEFSDCPNKFIYF